MDGRHRDVTGGAYHKFLALIEVTTAVVPGVVVHLIEVVIIVGRGIEGGSECSAVNRQGCAFSLGEEIIAVVGIGITGACHRIVCRPVDGTHTIKQAMAIDGAGGHLF